MNWQLGQVQEIAEIISGYAFKSDWFGSGSNKIIRIGDLQNGVIESNLSVVFDAITHKVPDKFKIKSGDILMALSGATVGKIAVAKDDDADAYLNQRVAIIRGKTKINSDYLKHVFSGSPLQKLLLSAGGAAQPNLSPKDLSCMEVFLPPPSEQKRIATILDKADAIRRKRQQAIQLADEFLRSVFLDMFGDPVTNPKGWSILPLSEIARIQIGPFGTQLHKEDYISGGIPLINPTHIKNNKIIPNHDLSITQEKHAELPEYHLEEGDIVMGRRGEMGRCAIVTRNEVGWFCGTGSLFIRPDLPGVFSEYLQRFLSSDYMKRQLESESLGATMPNLNKKIVEGIQVPVPSDKALKKFDGIKNRFIQVQVASSDANKLELFNSLSQRAFAGTL